MQGKENKRRKLSCSTEKKETGIQEAEAAGICEAKYWRKDNYKRQSFRHMYESIFQFDSFDQREHCSLHKFFLCF